jgi:tyrosine phenol-lyase
MGLATEGSRAFQHLARQAERFFGFPFVVPTTQGRAAERIWTKFHVNPGSVVAGNVLFPSTRGHIEGNGATLIDVVGDAAHRLDSEEPFKGNIDLERLAAVVREHAGRLSCVYIELALNACGGHPVSLQNLKAVRAFALQHKIPLFLDACRILENSYLIQQRDAACKNRSLLEIVEETCDQADGCTVSAMKDFPVSSGGLILTRDPAAYRKALMQTFVDGAQPSATAMELLARGLEECVASEACIRYRVEQVGYLWHRLEQRIPLLRPPAGHAVFLDLNKFLPDLGAAHCRAEALAAFLYEHAGIRVTKGPPSAPSQRARGIDLLRLAVPARKYVAGHLDDVAEAILYAYAHRGEIRGLRRIEDPARALHDPAHFAPL